jgi:hypothetical protein
MGKYGHAAVRAVELLKTKEIDIPVIAWNQAAIEIFGEGTSSQKKGCPRAAFIGLCEEGLVNGIQGGNNALFSSSKNKQYAIRAVDLIKAEPDLANDVKKLWHRVIEGETKVHNSQMDVVVTLWHDGLLIK